MYQKTFVMRNLIILSIIILLSCLLTRCEKNLSIEEEMNSSFPDSMNKALLLTDSAFSLNDFVNTFKKRDSLENKIFYFYLQTRSKYRLNGMFSPFYLENPKLHKFFLSSQNAWFFPNFQQNNFYFPLWNENYGLINRYRIQKSGEILRFMTGPPDPPPR